MKCHRCMKLLPKESSYINIKISQFINNEEVLKNHEKGNFCLPCMRYIDAVWQYEEYVSTTNTLLANVLKTQLESDQIWLRKRQKKLLDSEGT